MAEQLPSDQKVCKRHSWLVSRRFMGLTGKPMEVLHCRFCSAYKRRRLKAKKS